MKKVVFILGNGFDLDLGLKTSYKNFIESKALDPFNTNPVIKELIDRCATDQWFDIELFFRDKGTIYSPTNTTEETLNAYSLTKESLQSYILNLSYDAIEKESMARYLLCALLDSYRLNSNQVAIYDFNYTDFSLICKKFNLQEPCNFRHVHGSAKKGNINLGFEDRAKVTCQEYKRMYKSHNPSFRSIKPFLNDLTTASDIIFFGHSLGITDSFYFEDFFNTCARSTNNYRVTIITKNEDSAEAIRLRLEDIANLGLSEYQKKTDLRILTVDTDQEEIMQYCNQIRKQVPNSPRCYIINRKRF